MQGKSEDSQQVAKKPKPPLRFDASFDAGFGVRRPVQSYGWKRLIPEVDWLVAGRVHFPESADLHYQPFLISHQTVAKSPGNAIFWCPVVLGTEVRTKILDRLSTRVRNAKSLPPGLRYLDLWSHDWKEAYELTCQMHTNFYKDTWLIEFLPDQDGDWALLNVPYNDRADAEALGAVWDWAMRTYKVKRQDDMQAFSKWLFARAAEYPAELVSQSCHLV